MKSFIENLVVGVITFDRMKKSDVKGRARQTFSFLLFESRVEGKLRIKYFLRVSLCVLCVKSFLKWECEWLGKLDLEFIY